MCRSVLHISQDPIQGNGQKRGVFWDCIEKYYNQNKPIGGRPLVDGEAQRGEAAHRCKGVLSRKKCTAKIISTVVATRADRHPTRTKFGNKRRRRLPWG